MHANTQNKQKKNNKNENKTKNRYDPTIEDSYSYECNVDGEKVTMHILDTGFVFVCCVAILRK